MAYWNKYFEVNGSQYPAPKYVKGKAQKVFIILMLILNKSCCIKEILDDLQSATVQIFKKYQVIKSDNYWPRWLIQWLNQWDTTYSTNLNKNQHREASIMPVNILLIINLIKSGSVLIDYKSDRSWKIDKRNWIECNILNLLIRP